MVTFDNVATLSISGYCSFHDSGKNKVLLQNVSISNNCENNDVCSQTKTLMLSGDSHKGNTISNSAKRRILVFISKMNTAKMGDIPFFCSLAFCCLFLSGIALNFFSMPAVAQNVTSPESVKEVTERYLQQAFSNPAATLIKPFSKTPITLSIYCTSRVIADCDRRKFNNIVSKSIPSGPLLKFITGYSRSNITVTIFAKEETEALAQDFIEQNKSSDTSDPECMFVRPAATGSNGQGAKIAISTETGNLKIQACLLINIQKAIGLEVFGQKGFKEVWLGETRVSKFTEKKLNSLVIINKVISHLHMCKLISPGMSLRVAQNAVMQEECLSGLKLKNKK
jgi:hypothetical protein